MNRELAESIMGELEKSDHHLNNAIHLVEQIEDEAERKELRRGLGSVVGVTYSDVMRPIVRQYPELHPKEP